MQMRIDNSMINMEREKEIIRDVANRISDYGLEMFEPDMLINFLDDWYLSDIAKKYLGDTGVVRVPVNLPVSDLMEDDSEEIANLESIIVRQFNDIGYNDVKVTCTNKLKLEVNKTTRKSALKLIDFLRREYIKNNDEVDEAYLEVFSYIAELSGKLSSILSKYPEQYNGELVISALPSDILNMSNSGYGWTSCMSFSGSYSLSPSIYCMLGNKAIAYFVPSGASKMKIFKSSNELLDPKLNRVLIHMEEDLFALDAVYPEPRAAFSNLVSDVIGSLTGIKSKEDDPYHFEFDYSGYVDGVSSCYYREGMYDDLSTHYSNYIEGPLGSHYLYDSNCYYSEDDYSYCSYCDATVLLDDYEDSFRSAITEVYRGSQFDRLSLESNVVCECCQSDCYSVVNKNGDVNLIMPSVFNFYLDDGVNLDDIPAEEYNIVVVNSSSSPLFISKELSDRDLIKLIVENRPRWFTKDVYEGHIYDAEDIADGYFLNEVRSFTLKEGYITWN